MYIKRFKFGCHEPCIWHHNGRNSRNRNGIYAKKAFFDQFSNHSLGKFSSGKDKLEHHIPPKDILVDTTNVSNRVEFLLCSNRNERGSAVRCLEAYGYKYTIIGQKLKRYSHFLKYQVVRDYLMNNEIKSEYLICLDADDIFIPNPVDDLINNFETFYNCKMLFNAEVFFFPYDEKWGCEKVKSWEESVIPKELFYRYLCAGAWISNSGFLKSIMNLNNFPSPDHVFNEMHISIDQAFYKTLYRKLYPDIKIDYLTKWFLSTSWDSGFGKQGKMYYE